MQTVSRIIRPVTVAAGIAAPAASSRNRTGTEIFQLRNLLEHRRSLLFQFCKGIGHGPPPYTERITYARYLSPQKKTATSPTFMSRTRRMEMSFYCKLA